MSRLKDLCLNLSIGEKVSFKRDNCVYWGEIVDIVDDADDAVTSTYLVQTKVDLSLLWPETTCMWVTPQQVLEGSV